MFNEKDILARLQNGESADTIAAELADVLNKATATYKAEQDAKAKENEIKAKKIAVLDEILDAIYDFILEFYVESDEDEAVLQKVFDECSAEKLLKDIEAIGSVTADVKNFFDPTIFIDNKKKNPSVKVVKSKSVPDAVIADFLKSFGL